MNKPTLRVSQASREMTRGGEEMKKSEYIQKLIEIEEERGENRTITMNYIQYLKEQKRMIEIGDIELRWGETWLIRC